MKFLIKVQCLVALALCQLRHRDSRPAGDDPGDLLLGHTLVYQRQILALQGVLLGLKLLLQCRQFSVTEFRRFLQIALSLRNLDLAVNALNFFTHL